MARRRLPRSLRIRGETWRVRVVRDLTRCDGLEADGLCHKAERLIEIEKDLDDDARQAALLHEILHAAFPPGVVAESGWREELIVGGLEESLLEMLERAIPRKG